MNVRDVMSKEVKSCEAGNNLESVALLMWHHNCGSIPVVDETGHPIGILTDRDIAMAAALNHRPLWEMTAKDVMGRGAFFTCHTDDDVRLALKTMWAQKVRRLPVVNSEGHLEGILSIDDVLARAERGTRGQMMPPELSYDDAMMTMKALVARH